ncbi:MAG: DUF885 domain-containing protein [Myxococcota bacterium]
MTESPFAQLRQEFFRWYLATQPEEATTLGARGFDDKLRDLSLTALDDELRGYQRFLDRCDALAPTLTAPDDEIDCWTMRAICRFHLRAHGERQEHLRNVEMSIYPYVMLQHHMAHADVVEDWENVATRADAVPRYLAQQEALLRDGLRRGLRPDAVVTGFLVEQQLEAMADDLAALPRIAAGVPENVKTRLQHAGQRAADAFRAHRAFLRDDVLPHATQEFALGAEEYTWRLVHTHAVTTPVGELVARAEAILAELERDMTAQAAVVARERGEPAVTDHGSAWALMQKLQRETPAHADDVFPLYRERLQRAQDFMVQQKLFRMPDDAELRLAPTHAALRGVGNAINWPAPLLAPRRKGGFLLASDPAQHPLAWATIGAIHEGIPGHWLQSASWQRKFSTHPAPVRFLLVPDDVTIPRRNFFTNQNIEGFAVYAEEVMRLHGFHQDPVDALFALVGHAIRAIRVVVDIGLHTGRMNMEQAVAFLVRHASMPEETARAQVLRYRRIPMQAITYLLGRLDIEELKAAWMREQGSQGTEMRFHDELFSYGPTPPNIIRRHMLRKT